MPTLRPLTSAVKIEYLLLFLAVLTFCTTEFFRIKTSQKFDTFDRTFSEIEAGNASELENQLPADFSQVTKPYAYFNRNIAQEISNITVLLSENEESEHLYSALLLFQTKIHRIQRKVAFGYEMLLYFSAFLTLGSLALIIHKKNVQNTESLKFFTFCRKR